MKELTLLFKITFGIRRLRALAQARRQIQALEQEVERLKSQTEIVLNVNAFGWESIYIGMKVFGKLKQRALDFIGVAAEMETYKMQFETLYGSAQKAQQVLDQIKQFAATTPYEIAELTDAWRLMKAYGLEPNLRMMRAIGDAAASLGGGRETFQGIIVALGQMYAKGKVSAEELMQLAERGVPVYEILEEKLGLTRKQIANIGAAGIPAQRAIEAIVQGMEERFGGGMERLSKTWQGTISNLRDLAYQIKAAIGKPIMEVANRDLRRLVEWLNKVRQSAEFKRVIQGLAQGFVEFYRTIRATVLWLWKVIEPIVRFLAMHPNLMGKLMALIGAFSIVGIALGGLIVTAGALYGKILALQTAWVGLRLYSLKFATSGNIVAITFGRIGAAISGALRLLPVLFGSIAAAGWPVWLLLGALAIFVGTLFTAWVKNWGGIRDHTRKVFGVISRVIKVAFFIWLGLAKRWFSFLFRGLKALGSFFVNVWMKIARTVWRALTALYGAYGKAIKVAIGALGKLIGFVEKLLRKLSKAPGMGWAKKLANALGEVRLTADAIKRGRLGEVLSFKLRGLYQSGAETWGVIKKGVGGALAGAKRAAKSPIENLQQFATGGAGPTLATAPSPTINNYYLTQHFDRESVVITTGEIDAESFRELLGRIIKEEARG